jgi:hypothetical protein
MIRSLPPLLSLQLRNLYAETPCSFVSVMLTFALASEASQAQESLILQTRRLFFVFFFFQLADRCVMLGNYVLGEL